MKNIIESKIKYLVVFALLLILALFIPKSITVNADNSFTYSPVIPESKMEILDLNESGPIATAIYDNGVAIVKDDKSLLIYKDGEYLAYDKLERQNPFQIKNLCSGKVIVNDDGCLYKIDVTDLTKAPEKLTYNGNELLCRAFDVNGKYIVTVQGQLVSLFTLNDNYEIIEKTEPKITAADLTPVGVSDDGTIYYINTESNLLAFKDLSEKVIIREANDIKAFSFKDGKLYFVKANDIYSAAQDEVYSVNKLISPNTDYDLGKILNPTDISVYNDNLFITCSNSIQEYEIKDLELTFTGFAIADDKTAFNRIGKNVINVERYKDTLAILDDYKITLIDLSNEITKDSFKNLRVGLTTEDFTLGENTLLYKSTDLYILDLNTESAIPVTLNEGNIIDLTYQSGYYYALCGDNITDTITKISESGEVISTLPAEKSGEQRFAVDVFGKVFFAENEEEKIATDLNGNAYSVKGNTFYSLSDKVEFSIDKEISSFAMGFDKKEVYFTLKDQTGIFKTNSLSNLSLSELPVPQVLTQNKENALKQENTYSVVSGENIYGVEISDSFTFTSLQTAENEYYLTGEITLNNLTMYALSSKSGIVLVNKNSVTENPITYSTSPLKLYITTTVHAHYIPVLSLSCENYLYSDNKEITLTSGDVILTDGNGLLSFDGREFYFATIDIGGEEINGFIPAAFTVEVKSEEYTLKEFTIKQVNKTGFYTDSDMQNKAFTINDGTYVKILSTKGKISKIAIELDDGFITGYMYSSAIKNSPNVALRNILIIVILSVCVLGSTMFFVLRKKK